ncbi:MAG: site-specific integrase, partial [Flavisolibacter sp.]
KNWLDKDPFMAYKVKAKKTERAFLTELELKAIQAATFTIERLNQVREIFIFSCYTALVHIDLYDLSPNHIVLGIDGEKWASTQ